MKKALTLVILLCVLLIPTLAEAQPTPPDVPTLGPALTIISSGSDHTNVKIISPINQTNYSGELKLTISVEAVGMLGQFGNVGYSIDGGTINSIRNIAKSVDDKTGYPDWYWWKTTAKASLSLPNLPEGFHTITVYYGWQYPAYLEVTAYTTVDFTIGAAHATPEIYINSPSNLSTNNNSTLLSFYLRQIQPTATNAAVYYSLDGENYSISSIDATRIATMVNQVTTFNQEIANISDGFHTLSVYCRVSYLHNWVLTGNSSVQFTVDTAPPKITVLSITNKTYDNQNLALSLNLNENASWISYSLDKQGNTAVQGNTTLKGLSYGSHNIVVYANDTVGNVGSSDTIYFNVAKPFPTAQAIAASIGLIAVLVTGLLVYFKKRKR